MAFTKIKTKDLAGSATLKRSRRRRIVFLSTSNSRSFDERIGRHPSKNKQPLSAMAEPHVAMKMDAKSAHIISVPESQPKSKNQNSKPPKKPHPEINLIKKEQEASSETSESSNSSTRPPSIFDRDEVNGKTGPVDTPPSSPASETPDSERKKQKPTTKQEKRESKKQASSQQQQHQQQQSKTSTPNPKPKTKSPVEQAKSDRPQVSSQKNPSKPNKTAGQSRPGKKTEMANLQAQRQQFLDNLDRKWPNPKLGGHGLFNPKDFCYRRSALQCLLNIPLFVNWLSAHRRDHKRHCPGQIQELIMGKPSIKTARACFACALLGLARAYWKPQSKREVLEATKHFDLTMKKIAHSTSIFPMGMDPAGDFMNQQDANEFCLWMLNVLASHNQMDSFEYRSIFGIDMRKAWTCPKCGHVSRSSDEDVHLSISIQQGHMYRLESYMEKDLLHERMEGVYCENEQCSYYTGLTTNKPKDGMVVSRRTAFAQLPEVLIIQLRRFGTNTVSKGKGKSRWYEEEVFKIDDAVAYPPVLDLSKYLAQGSENEEARYALNGVICQIGTLRRGHYFARTVTPMGVRKISDSLVQSIKLSDLLQPRDKRDGSTPYVLFYTRLRDGEASPLFSNDGTSKPKPKPKPKPAGSKTGSAKNGSPNASQPHSSRGSLGRSDSGFQRKRKFSDAQPSPGFKKHKQTNHRSNKF